MKGVCWRPFLFSNEDKGLTYELAFGSVGTYTIFTSYATKKSIASSIIS